MQGSLKSASHLLSSGWMSIIQRLLRSNKQCRRPNMSYVYFVRNACVAVCFCVCMMLCVFGVFCLCICLYKCIVNLNIYRSILPHILNKELTVISETPFVPSTSKTFPSTSRTVHQLCRPYSILQRHTTHPSQHCILRPFQSPRVIHFYCPRLNTVLHIQYYYLYYRWEFRIVPCLAGGNASATCLKMLFMRFADVQWLRLWVSFTFLGAI